MIKDNLKEVQQRIQSACQRSGRNPDSVTLIGVSKYVSIEEAQELAALGVNDFGENRLPGALEKNEALKAQKVHFIGHLQTNKVNKIVGIFESIHSVDSDALLEAIIKRAQSLGVTQKIFIQINVSGEESKGGYLPEQLSEVLQRFSSSPELEIQGLMTMAPHHSTPESLHEIFKGLSDLAQKHNLSDLSMGMSSDFEIAIEEGATHIRVGSLLFKTE
jgi:pyridoxal phosphate enzyme (YggS family)